MANNEQLYKKRNALVEYPFGTIKRQWGIDHIITKKGLESASTDFGLIALTYNLKRLINILSTHKDHKNTFFEMLYYAFRTIFRYLEVFTLTNNSNIKSNKLVKYHSEVQFLKCFRKIC